MIDKIMKYCLITTLICSVILMVVALVCGEFLAALIFFLVGSQTSQSYDLDKILAKLEEKENE